MAGIQVSWLEPDDWATMRAVRLAALADSPAAFGSTAAREAAFGETEWRRRIASVPAFVAWRDSEPIGLAGVVNRKEIVGTPADQWELVAMWVSPQARGTGAADLLVSAVLGALKAEHADRLTLWVADGNARARAFYVRFGFEPTGARQVFRRDDGSEFDEEEFALPVRRDATSQS